MAEQVTRFPERDEPAMWAAKDEQHAIECRQKAYAEAAEARRADDAVNAYKRDLELRRRQRAQQQKKGAKQLLVFLTARTHGIAKQDQN